MGKKNKKRVLDGIEINVQGEPSRKRRGRRRRLSFRYPGTERRALTIRSQFGNDLDNVSVDLTREQADTLLQALMFAEGYSLPGSGARPKSEVCLTGKRTRWSMRGLWVMVVESTGTDVALWITQQCHGVLSAFVEHRISRPNLHRLIEWLAPRLDWETYEIDEIDPQPV